MPKAADWCIKCQMTGLCFILSGFYRYSPRSDWKAYGVRGHLLTSYNYMLSQFQVEVYPCRKSTLEYHALTKEISGCSLVFQSDIVLQVNAHGSGLFSPQRIESSHQANDSLLVRLLLPLAKLTPTASLSLLLLLLLQKQQSVDLVLYRVLRCHRVGNLLPANQAGHNASAHNECQHKPVHAVPRRRVATARRSCVRVVQEGEGQELADQCVLHREQQRRPGHRRGHHTSGVALVANLAAKLGPFKTPVDGSEERKDLIIYTF